MNPLIITATANICWLKPDVPYPQSPGEIAAEARLCQEQGATICHTHAEGRWAETIQAIRTECDIVVQCGMSSLQIEERMDVFTHRSDMISIILNHHDEAFVGRDFHVLHPREELEAYMRLCTQHGVAPEFEVWNTGSIWNLKFLMDKGLVQPPCFTTLFFGWPGGAWSPATVEEYLYRRRLMPPGSVVNVSIMGSEQIGILTAAIVMGDHVRVGTEDYPFKEGRVVSTHELVAGAAEIARSVGRPVATVAQAREIIGL
jgi:3-keto-5-aminohexanoate cleavage enzyme